MTYGRRRQRGVLAGGLALVVVLLTAGLVPGIGVGAPPASAMPNVIAAARNQFLPAEVVIAEGTGLTFANTDAVPHDVTSDEPGLFHSSTIVTGTSRVVGVEDLAPNTYTFYCTVHTEMWGLLTVVDTPSPVDHPPAQSLPPVANALGASVPTPTSIAFTPAGDALLATSWALGSVFRLPVLAGGLLGPATEYATGFDNPLGVTVAPDGTLFVADSYPSTRPGRDRDGRVWALPPGGGAAGTVGSVVASELPNGRHDTNNLTVAGGRLYITNGNSTDDGVAGGVAEEPPWSGALLSVPLSARGLTPSNAPPGTLVIEATGMRNLYDVALRPGTREAWITMNGPDALAPFGEDLLLRATVSDPADPTWAAADFGFPGCVYRAGPSGEPQVGQNPAVATTHQCSPSHRPPEQLLGLHVSADGLAFGPGPDGGFWGGDLFVAEFGSFNGVEGHRIVRVPVDASGRSAHPVDFFVGAAPLDLAFGPAGTGLYVADFATGQITLLRSPTP
jgi:glucose/arabinose dehydrogenase/plastocyanin